MRTISAKTEVCRGARSMGFQGKKLFYSVLDQTLKIQAIQEVDSKETLNKVVVAKKNPC
jgi:hypothetical protein